ncbi:bifunctional oligoribonuclease/PAP phosphatase NrnA [Candidatus Omnitrophota bacterium]
MKINKKTKDRIRKFLRKHNNFLISAHTSPEGDSLGAQLAFAGVIKSMGKRCDIVNSDRPSREYSFLPGIGSVRSRPRVKKYDAAVILDCSDLSRIGSVVNFLDKDAPILNIDHHISNDNFGDINFVDARASSACEVLYLLFRELNLKINRNVATCLYTGILTDTGSFRYTNTGTMTHFVVSELLKWNVDVVGIYRSIYQNLNLLDLKYLNCALSRIKQDPSGKVAWIKLTQKLIKKYRPKVDLSDNILNSLRSINEVEVCVLFRERSGQDKNIRINLRSRSKFDVNKVAQRFGGGGHKTASGVTLRNTSLKKAESMVIGYIKSRL